jgi:hypothetical protein
MSKTTNNISSINGETLKYLHQSFITGINNFKATAPREFLEKIGLDYQKLFLGFNSGQFHHRKDDAFKAPFIELGVLTKSDAPVREPGMIGYSTFGDYGIIFPLKDKDGCITNMYALRIKLQNPKGEYLNEKGLYPNFPNLRTTKLFLTENVIDSASLIQADVLENRDSVIALSDGKLTIEIRKAIEDLAELSQLIVIARTDNEVLTNELKKITTAHVTTIVTPEMNSVNDMLLLYGNEGLQKFINEIEASATTSDFRQISDKEFFFKGQEVSYHIQGMISQNPTLMEFDFEIEADLSSDNMKAKIDLLDELETEKKIYFWTENNNMNSSQIILELKGIKTELEKVRRDQGKPEKQRGFSTKQDKLAKQLLKSDNLFEELDELIGKAGEEQITLVPYCKQLQVQI